MPPIRRAQPRAAAPAPADNANDANHDIITETTNLLPLFPRQQQTTTTTTIPAYYGSLHSGPDPGTVAGITLGSVAGFVLLLWLVYTCINMGNPNSGANDTSTVVTEGTASVIAARRRRASRHASRSRRAAAGEKETVEIRARGSGGRPVIVEEVVSSVGGPSEVDRVIVEERRRSVSRARMSHPPPPRRVASSEGSYDEDEVVVIEEHSPPPRRHRSRVRSVERRSSGFREVDPDRFAGGDASFVEVRRSGSRRR